MIVDFTIENFRSIKSEQLLSMHADKKPKHHAGNISYIEENIGVLKTCAIYGPNAAGKTNILLAFEALKELITLSGDWKDGDLIQSYAPYLLSDATRELPTRFEIEFYIEELRYKYYVEYNSKQIVSEKLDFYPTARAANLFTRKSPSEWQSVKFGERYKGGKKQVAFFENNTYLAKAGNTPDSPEIIRKIYNYFRNNTISILGNNSIGVFDWEQDEKTVSIINTFLNKIDLGIKKFGIENDDDFNEVELPDDMPDFLKEKLQKEFAKKECFYHPDENGDLIRFDKEKESKGTNKLFKVLPFFIQVLRQGTILFVDEIEGSFHPHIAELIIRLFNDPLVNKKNAQLIFTTHDLMLMGPETMRKDQIYLTEKNINGGTQLYCLESYESALKDNSPFAKWYDEGRLGAIPKIDYRNISDSIKSMF